MLSTDLCEFFLDDAQHHRFDIGGDGCLSGRAGRGTIVAVVSGGNIDLSRFAQLVGAAPRPA